MASMIRDDDGLILIARPTEDAGAAQLRLGNIRIRRNFVAFQIDGTRRRGAEDAKIGQLGIVAQGIDDDDAGINVGLSRHTENESSQTDQRRGQISPQHRACHPVWRFFDLQRLRKGQNLSDQTVGQDDLSALYGDD
jgi:hypothetical protein